MSIAKVSLRALCLSALLAASPLLHAGKGHDHAKPDSAHKHDHGAHKHDHGKHEHDHGKHEHALDSAANTSHDGMTALYRHLGEMERELAAGSLEGIHGHDEAIQAAVKSLDKDPDLTDAKRKRVQGYVKNVLKLTGKMHAAADAKQPDQVKAEFAKLKAQVDLLDKQFAHSHKPAGGKTGKPAAAHSHH